MTITSLNRSCKLLTEKETANMLRVSTSFLQKERFKHQGLPYVKIGKSVRYLYDDIVAYTEKVKISVAK